MNIVDLLNRMGLENAVINLSSSESLEEILFENENEEELELSNISFLMTNTLPKTKAGKTRLSFKRVRKEFDTRKAKVYATFKRDSSIVLVAEIPDTLASNRNQVLIYEAWQHFTKMGILHLSFQHFGDKFAFTVD